MFIKGHVLKNQESSMKQSHSRVFMLNNRFEIFGEKRKPKIMTIYELIKVKQIINKDTNLRYQHK